MIAQQDEFLNLSRINIAKYASESEVNRYFFDYVFLHESDIKTAHTVSYYPVILPYKIIATS